MNKDGGFTLVEIMVTILMVGIATAGLSSIFISIRNVQLQTAMYDTATRAAQRQIESLRNDSYVSLASGSTINFTSSLPTSLPQATGVVAVSTPAADLRRVDVTVTYKAQGVTRTVVESSLIGQIGITQ